MSRNRLPLVPKGEGGFTLLEIVVALTLLGVLFAAAFGVFAAGLRSSRYATEYTRAVIEGERILQDVTAKGVQAGVAEGLLNGGYRWRAEIRPHQAQIDESPAQLFHVRVSVLWPSAKGEKQLNLETLAMAPRVADSNTAMDTMGRPVDVGRGQSSVQGIGMPAR